MAEKERIILQTKWFGTFLVKGEEVIDKILFPKDVDEIADRKLKRDNGEILDEERELAEKADGKLYVSESRLSGLGEVKKDVFQEIDAEYYSYDDELLHEAMLEVGRTELEEIGDVGKHLAKAVNTIKDLNEGINILMERLRDWYSLHFPELEENASDEEFLQLIVSYGERTTIMEEEDIDIDSIGGEVTKDETELYQELADIIIKKKSYLKKVQKYVEDKMSEYAPTVNALTGPKLGGELIAQAGSLEELAKMPASTIQLLGAEKSLFRHLQKGSKPPKHGYILQHPYVHDADPEIRGKIARAFANKIAIAARIDYFGERDKGEELRGELEERIEKIKKC